MDSSGAPARLRAAHRRGAGRPLRPPVVHRRARAPEGFAITPGRARERARGGHDLRRLVDRRATRRVQESDMLAMPDPNTLRDPARGPTATDARGPRCSATSSTSTAARSRATPARCCSRNLERAREKGFTLLRRPPRWSSSTSTGRRRPAAQPARPGRLLRPHHRRRRRRPAQADDPHARGDGHPRRVQLPRGRAQPARDRPALHRRADDGRQRHDVPARREGGRRRRTACTRRSCPSRSRACRARACTRTSRCSRATSTRSTTPATSTACRRSAKDFIAGLLRHAAEITAVTNQWVNSYKRLIAGLRGAGLHVLGAQQPVGPRRVPPIPSRASRARPASSSARPTRPATRTSRSR